MEPIRLGVDVSSSPILLSSSCSDEWAAATALCSFCKRSRSFCGDCIRSFLGGAASFVDAATDAFVFFSGVGDGFLTILPAPGRSAKPVRGCGVVGFCGEPVFDGASVGMLDVGLAVMTTSSSLPPLLFGLCSGVPYALAGPGEFSLRNEEGNLERGVSFRGEPNLPLPPLDDGVDGTGEFGSDLSKRLC